MRKQKGYVHRRGKYWYLRYDDSVIQSDGTIKRVQPSVKLARCGDQYRTKESVKDLVREKLEEVNGGAGNPDSRMLVSQFIESVHLPKLEAKKRASTVRGYREIWNIHVKRRIGELRLRDFRTVHGEQMLADIAREYVNPKNDKPLSHNSLARMKSFLSGVFKQAKRLGVLDGINPMMDVSIPEGSEGNDVYTYSLEEVEQILDMLGEPERTVVLTATLSGLRKGEIRGLRWEDFSGTELMVERSIWNSTINKPKTKASKAPIPVAKPLADALNDHRERMGELAEGYIFQSGVGTPLNLDNLAKRVIIPAIEKCAICRKPKKEHRPEGHLFEYDKSLPRWFGWHAFRRGLATKLHQLGVDDKTIQGILRHSTLKQTTDIYIKSMPQPRIDAVDLLGSKLKAAGGTYTERAATAKNRVQ